MFDDVLGSFGKVVIGNNVFIGTKALILKGVTIGDNVVIAAGSVVTSDCESNSVYAGVPARKISSIEDYYKKRVNAQLKEAKELFLAYYEMYGQVPPKQHMSEFFFLFEDRSLELDESFIYQMRNNDRFEDCKTHYLRGSRQQFKSYEEFSNYCLNEMKNTKI